MVLRHPSVMKTGASFRGGGFLPTRLGWAAAPSVSRDAAPPPLTAGPPRQFSLARRGRAGTGAGSQ